MAGWLKKLFGSRKQPVAGGANSRAVFNQGYLRGRVQAKYDAAGNDSDNFEHWARGVDALSADAANSPAVRKRIRERARYEYNNNGYLTGIVETLVNDLVGSGPQAQIAPDPANGLTPAIAAEAEADWNRLRAAASLDQKFQVIARSKIVDGESFALLFNNPAHGGPVALDIAPVECDQVTDPSAANDPDNVDGVKLDGRGNVVSYLMLKNHPGGVGSASVATVKVPASQMIHWFSGRRPGQHRGVSDLANSLGLMALLRRYVRATVRTAEYQASAGGVLEAPEEPGAYDESVVPESAIAFQRGEITALPYGYKFHGFEATQPNSNMDMFERCVLQEVGRGLNVPLVVVLMNASGFNFASGRLDHLVYFKNIRVDRRRFAHSAVSPVFFSYWDEWRRLKNYEFLPDRPSVDFIFPGFEFLDLLKETNAYIDLIDAGLMTEEDVWMMLGKDPEKARAAAENAAAWRKRHGYDRTAAKHGGATGDGIADPDEGGGVATAPDSEDAE